MLGRFRQLLAFKVVAVVASAWIGVSPFGLASAQGGYAETFELTGLVENPRTFTSADLASYPQVTLTAAYGSGTGFEVRDFTGVRVWDLLRDARVRLNSSYRNDLNRKYLVATGSDGYEQIFSLAEVNPDYGAEMVVIAYMRDGQPLGPDEGMARIVIDTDKRGSRLVSNLVRLEVRDVDSLPRQ